MSVEGDARPERQSSSAEPAWFERARRFAQFAFAGFVFVHFAVQAWRAFSEGAHPEPGPELQPWIVALTVLVVWLPFSWFTLRKLRRALSGPVLPQNGAQARALAFAEQLALWVVVLFTAAHAAQLIWPLLSGGLAPSDIRPELVLALSSTSHGLPVQGAAFLCGVGAASFYAVRQARHALPQASPRALAAFGVLAYLLGSYAVIRISGGALFP